MIRRNRSTARIALACLVVALLGTGGAVRAAPIRVFTSQATFAAATTSRATDDYDDLTGYLGLETPGPSSALPRIVGTDRYVATSTSPLGIDCFFTGANPSDPTQSDLWLGTNYQPDFVTLDGFVGGISAIGGRFFTTDIDDVPTATAIRVTVTLADLSTLAMTLAAPGPNDFVGFAGNGIGIRSLRIDNLDAGDPATFADGGGTFVTLNDVVLARAVPEPAVAALLVLGALAGLGIPRRRAGR